MKNLLPIVNSLDGKEKRLIRKFLSIQTNGMEQKKLQLFDIILDKKVGDDKEACHILYNSEPNSAFSHVKRRLKKDLLNFILLQDAKRKDSPKRVQAEVDCRRMTLQGQLLLQRGIYDEGEKLLNAALDLAETYEMFSEVLSIRNYLRTIFGFRKGLEVFEKYSENMDYALEELGKWLKIRKYYNQIALPNEFQTNKMMGVKDVGEKILADLEKFEGKESSERFTFWYYVSKMHYYNINKNFEKAREFSKEPLKLAQKGSIMSSKTNYAGILKDIIFIHINLGDNEQAVEYSREAVKTFRKGTMNELRAMDYLLFAHLRNEDYDAATKVVEDALKHKQINTGNKLIKARWLFFRANLEYLQGDLNAAAKSLSTNDHITSDKSGWNLGYKLLQMMIHIDENDLFLVDYQIKNFNRLLSPKKTETENIGRARVISKVIRLFIKHRGDFKETFEVAKDEIAVLSEGKDELFWDPMGYEVIRFDEWLKRKRDEKKNRRQHRFGSR